MSRWTLPIQAALLADLPDPGLALVAQHTGGGYTEIRFGQDLGAAVRASRRRITQPLPPRLRSAETRRKVHDIDVRIAKPGLKSRSRKSYVAPK